MKNVMLILTTVVFVSCGGSEKGSSENGVPQTYEEKVASVCDCFNDASTDQSKRMECMKLQSDVRKTIEGKEKQKEFVLETNKCYD